MADEMEDLLKDFVNESREHLADIESDLLVIEEGGEDIDENLVNKVFRAAHSIKGGAGFFGLEKVKELAHKAETVLDMLRSRKIKPSPEVTNVLLAAFDKLREMIDDPHHSDQVDISELVENLIALASSWLPPKEKPALRSKVTLKASSGVSVELPQTDVDRAKDKGHYIYYIVFDLIKDVEQKGLNLLELFNDITSTGEILECSVDLHAVGTLEQAPGVRFPVQLVFATILKPNDIGLLFQFIEEGQVHVLFDPDALTQVPPAPVAQAPIEKEEPGKPPEEVPPPPPASVAPKKVSSPAETPIPTPPKPGPPSTVEETIRINVGVLDTLMNLAGELVLSRNQLRAAVASSNSTLLFEADRRIDQVTAELQDAIMQTRLQPIGNILAKIPRMVRDLSQALGKEIELDIRGKEVAMDKTMIEGLSDPITHMVRNAVDHGIETPEERIRAGKRPTGTLRIEAMHEAGMVVLEIADDGKGIDGDKVAEAAIRKGLISPDKVQGLSHRDKQALIFLPGLSTAEKVSEVSGRGVGMDVVKTNLDRLGAQVEIDSQLGKGTTFRIKLPLTLAIIPSLIVSVEQEYFAIPQASIQELLRLRPEEVRERIEIVGNTHVLLLREHVLPLIRLADVLGIERTYIDPVTGLRKPDRRRQIADRRSKRLALDEVSDGKSSPLEITSDRRAKKDRRQSPESALEIAVVTTGVMTYGLIVGAFHDTEEVVVKPLGRRFKSLKEYSGATILGDGRLALILDLAGLATRAGLTSISGSARAMELAKRAETMRFKDTYSLLLFYNGPTEPCALPLEMVNRIEQIGPRQIERLGNRRTMQYRGGSLPLVAISDVAQVADVDEDRPMVVLVCTVRGREVGLLGNLPVDVVEIQATIDQKTHTQKGIAGSSVLNGTTTLIVDLFELVDHAYPEWALEKRSLEQGNPRQEPHEAKVAMARAVLLAEDSDFFRNQIKRFIEEDGFTVFAAPDGEVAWEMLLRNLDKVGVVVTDIEMPKLTGLGLAQRIRADDRTAHLPIIAVTSLAGEEDISRGYAAGINEYQIKLDREKLLESIHRVLGNLD